MLYLRIREVNEDGTTDSTTRVIETKQITYTGVLNAVSTLTFQASRADWAPTVTPFVVRVEYSTGGPWAPLPEHDLFIFEEDSDDSQDAGQIVTYTGVAYVPWILTGTYVGDGPWNTDGERAIDGGMANAGRILDYFFTESTSRGPWLKHLVWNFNGTRDSANVNWVSGDREELWWRVDKHWYSGLLTQMTEQGMCDWSTSGTELKLFRPGTRGTDRSSEIRLGGEGFDRVPVKTDATGQFTHVVSQYEEGRTWTTNAAAETRFGRRSKAVDHAGVKSAAASQRLSQKLLDEGQLVKREEGFQWVPKAGMVIPFRDFSLGDLVTAYARGGKQQRRTVAVVVSQGTDTVTVRVSVGERVSALAAKNQKKLDAVTGGSLSGGTGGVFPTTPDPVKPVPSKPLGLHEVSNVGAFKATGARADVTLAWSPVTDAVDGSGVTVTEYGLLRDGVEVLRTNTPSVTVEIPSGVTYEYRVVAYVGADRQSDPSDPVTVTGALPATFALTPTVPVLSSSHGSVRAVWDGAYTSSAPAGAHTVRVEARVGSGAWVQQGSALTSAGEQLVSVGSIGDTVEVRLRAFDQLGRLTGTSATTSIEVQGVGLSDLNEEVNDYLSDIETMALEAQQSADGGNKIHYGNTAPAGTDHKVGDTWFDGANGNRINEWNGSAWVLAELGSNAIANLAITNAKIANLDAAKITTGELDADRIGAKSITARKLLISDLTNYAANIQNLKEREAYPVSGSYSYLEDGTRSPGGTAAPWVVQLGAGSGYATATAGENFSVTPGEELFVSFKAMRLGATVNATLNLRPMDSQGQHYGPYDFRAAGMATSSAPEGEWVEYSGIATVPEGAYLLQPQWKRASNGQTDGLWLLADPVIRRATSGKLIVDGSIKSHLMDAEEIYANQAHMNVLSAGLAQFDEITGLGNSLNITANESIELAVGRQDATDQQLSELREDVDGTIDAAEHAATVANEAHIAALAAGADLVAQNSRLEDVESGLTDQQAHFKILPGGVQVAFDDQSASLDMTPESIRFMSQGTAVAEISQEAIIIHKGIFEQAQIGNHLMQKRGNRTTFTPIEGS